MAVNPDFRDLFATFSAARARYLVVGGYAVGFHSEPRYTKDLDVWVEATPENANRVHGALTTFGAPTANLTIEDLTKEGLIYQIGVPPNRIDILTSISGVRFEEAWAARGLARYSDVEVPLIGREHLIVNKRAVGRPQDLLDVERLVRAGLGS